MNAAATRLAEVLERHERLGALRLITCGSVDDGKSTLIGRLLHEARALLDDQLATLREESRRRGGEGIDFALLVDGLAAEREQGITIDVAWRYFATDRRRFVVADCPGHAQYTRNMATGASSADLAVVLVDARKGLLEQTRRHSYICALLGIDHVVLAVNKMDQVGYRREVYEAIAEGYRAMAASLGIGHVTCIPVSALAGDNLGGPSPNMPWYRGPHLLEHLESVEVEADRAAAPLRFPVQWVCRPDQDFRGLAGTVAAGRVAVGDAVVVQPSGQHARVGALLRGGVPVGAAVAGEAVVLQLDRDLDVGRGDLVAAPGRGPQVADAVQARVLWMHEAPLSPGRRLELRAAGGTVAARLQRLVHRIDVNDQACVAAAALQLNEVGLCELVLEGPLVFDPYSGCRETGGFVLIDPEDHATVAAGFIEAAAVRDRVAAGPDAGGFCLWLTGLSGAGKSTLATRLAARLRAQGRAVQVLDGDVLREGLNADLDYSEAGRAESVRRTAEVARLMAAAGLVVVVAMISPYRRDRDAARARFPAGGFAEVHVDAPLAVAEARDPKGLYARARSGGLAGFTGIDAPYEAPPAPELVLDTAGGSIESAVDALQALVPKAGGLRLV